MKDDMKKQSEKQKPDLTPDGSWMHLCTRKRREIHDDDHHHEH